ncbi:MAG TPA: 3-deoxy-8-phosphooctulonate synthase [Bacteroidota bacterium]|nr:3-deoxy-8-phosphooctulonate synthase [Bacteroidota bacterium]
MNPVIIRNHPIGGGHPLVVFAGPCVVEGREITLRTADAISRIAGRLKFPLVFKSSYKKANRTSGSSFSGLDMEEALSILREVREKFDLPIVTDIHTEAEAATVADVVDVLQIPAFLCRQTDLLRAAGRTGRVVNVKKGQFLAPEDMLHAAEKIHDTGNMKVLFTERGTTFGYHNLVVDMRGLAVMRGLGCPVILDATHSVQLPGGDQDGKKSGGQPQFIFPIARAGVAAGIDGLFLEVHPDPPHALSDAASQLPLGMLESLLQQVRAIDDAVRTSGVQQP